MKDKNTGYYRYSPAMRMAHNANPAHRGGNAAAYIPDRVVPTGHAHPGEMPGIPEVDDTSREYQRRETPELPYDGGFATNGPDADTRA